MVLTQGGGESDGSFEASDGNFSGVERFDKPVEFGGADGVGNGSADREVALGISVDIAGLLGSGREDGLA